MATSPAEGMASLYRNLEAATGKSIDEWTTIARATGIGKHKVLVDHIKTDYGLTHGYANQIALRALASDEVASGTVDPIEAQYSGTRAAMKPLYNALCDAISDMGDDIEFAPKKAYVSIRRSKQFAILQPATGRIDIGLVLKEVPVGARLEASGSFNAMLTHRVRIQSVEEIDAELMAWLRVAYEAACC